MAILVGRSASTMAAMLIISMMLVAIPVNSEGEDTMIVPPSFSEIVKVGNWTVTGMESYSSSNITLSGNLSVDGTLILDNVNLFLNGSGNTLSSIIINSGGTIQIRNNSMINGLNNKRYHMRAVSGSIVNIADSIVKGCGVQFGETWRTGLTVETIFFNMTNSEVINGFNGIIVNGGSAVLSSVQIESIEGSGLQILNGSSVRTSWVNFTGCFTNGIDINGSSAEVSDSIFDQCYTAVNSLSSNIIINRSLLISISQTTVCLNGSEMDLIDSYLPVPGNDMIKIDEPVGNSSVLFLLNTTPGDLMVLDSGASVQEAYRHDFRVLTNDEQPATGAVLTIRDSQDDIESVVVTDQSGVVLNHPVTRYKFDQGGLTSMEPHNLTVDYDGASRQLDFSTVQSYCEIVHVLLSQPVVEISEPAPGSWMPSSSLTVSGTVEDPRPIVDLDYILNGMGAARIEGSTNSFNVDLSLLDGEHQITIVAGNDDGRIGFDMVTFGIDTVFPKITIDRSIIPDYTHETFVTIKGTCDEAESKVYVGEDMAPHSTGTFNVSYPLSEGRNEIIVKAVDRAGNTAEITLDIVSDTIPPPIHVRSFLNGSRVRGESIWVNGTTDMNTEKILVNGENVPFFGDSFSHLLTGIVEGENIITVTVVDRTGMTSTWEGIIFVDNTAPDLIVFDLPSATNLESFRIRGRTEPGSRVLVNTLVADVAADEWSIVIDLFPGSNPVHITAYDDLGNGIEISHIIIYDNTPPVIENIEPTPGSTIRNPALTIQVSIFDENELSLVRGRSGDGDFRNLEEGDKWGWTVTLSIGANNLTLEVVDLAGNSIYRDFVYIYYPRSEEDTELPTVIINSPESGSKHSPGNINIEGEAYDNIRVDVIQIRINGSEWSDIEGSTIWHYLFNFSRGMNSIEVRAVDEAGNIGDITMISILVVEPDSEESSDSGSLWIILSIIGAIIFIFLCFVLVYTFVSFNRLKATQEGLEEAERESREFRGRPAPVVGRERERREGLGRNKPSSGGRKKQTDTSDEGEDRPGPKKARKPHARKKKRD